MFIFRIYKYSIFIAGIKETTAGTRECIIIALEHRDGPGGQARSLLHRISVFY